MKLSDTKRKYLAGIFGRSAEFVISILLIGQLVTGRLSLQMFLAALCATSGLIVFGTWLTPDNGTKENARKGV